MHNDKWQTIIISVSVLLMFVSFIYCHDNCSSNGEVVWNRTDSKEFIQLYHIQ